MAKQKITKKEYPQKKGKDRLIERSKYKNTKEKFAAELTPRPKPKPEPKTKKK